MLGLATARAARHRFREAIDLARTVAASQPKDADAYTIIGDAYLGMGDLAARGGGIQRGGRARARIHDRQPAAPTFCRRAGNRARRLRSCAKALADATSRDLPIESRAWCHVMIGATLFDLGDWTAAEPEYQAA